MRTIFTSLFFLCFILICHSECKADTLLINIKHPDKERILLFDGKYFIKFDLGKSYEGDEYKELGLRAGTYKIINKKIYFSDPSPKEDTIISKYFIWPSGLIGPNYTFDFYKVTQDIFGFPVNINGVGVGGTFLISGKFLSDRIIKIKHHLNLMRHRNKYKLETRQ